MRFKKFVKLYDMYSVSVSGSKGSGKDLITANVIARRKRPYISNVDYKCKYATHYPFDYSLLDCGGNTYENFLSGNIIPYEFPYPDFTDLYLSDCGIYFPSQYNGELNKKFREFPTFMALSRQLGNCYVHTNTQSLNRVWDKIREQNDYFIRCRRSFVLFGKICITFLTTYDKADSCLNRVRPCRVTVPMFAPKNARMQARIYRDTFYNQHGEVKDRVLIYWNKSKYNTRLFKEMLKPIENETDN